MEIVALWQQGLISHRELTVYDVASATQQIQYVMGQIIRFPHAKKPKAKKINDLLVDRLSNIDQHSDIGNFKFTCATCGNVGQFKFSGAVFKELSFYCSSCGVGYKIDNPLFSSNRKSKPK